MPALRQWTFDAEQAEKISQPTRMIHTPAWTERKPFGREWFPEVDYHVLEGVTHLLQMEDPRAVAEGISRAFFGVIRSKRARINRFRKIDPLR